MNNNVTGALFEALNVKRSPAISIFIEVLPLKNRKII